MGFEMRICTKVSGQKDHKGPRSGLEPIYGCVGDPRRSPCWKVVESVLLFVEGRCVLMQVEILQPDGLQAVEAHLFPLELWIQVAVHEVQVQEGWSTGRKGVDVMAQSRRLEVVVPLPLS